MPEQSISLVKALSDVIPNLGIILDCCNKPSHDLGNQDKFTKAFSHKLKQLQLAGICQVITACPSCLHIFKKYGNGLQVSMVYEHLQNLNCSPLREERDCTIHDPCTVRFDSSIQRNVREIARSQGIQITEMEHNGNATLCCGEGGATDFLEGTSTNWKDKRMNEIGKRPVLTYCAGCTAKLQPAKTVHLLDVLFGNSRFEPVSPEKLRPIKRYMNRLFFKRKVNSIIDNK